ncbi:hypothetical protein DM02DRAFT_729364 [Periconia macrospinosa]|uniref:Uncharacterized protein n=1 Tax=Periconia macrospinosa TaxID=97972 RepID=A0A2V1DMC2_9PLEO|nr:hypothetical protein DM02DRAFT_729364 [Periconia macrospinosa]
MLIPVRRRLFINYTITLSQPTPLHHCTPCATSPAADTQSDGGWRCEEGSCRHRATWRHCLVLSLLPPIGLFFSWWHISCIPKRCTGVMYHCQAIYLYSTLCCTWCAARIQLQ